MKILKGGNVSRLLAGVTIPKMFRARQIFPGGHIEPEEIPEAVTRELSRPEVRGLIRPGMRIAVTAGSRGIANVAIITKAIVDFIKSRQAYPFIVPAMGSHGGATAEGQAEILAGYGITEKAMGCPVRSSMEVVEIGVSDTGKTVRMDRFAFESDGIVVSCRIKPHNSFRGPYESGVCKMIAVGLGKQAGAELVHSDGVGNLARNIPSMARVAIEKAPILLAIPCIENAYDQTLRLEAMPADRILEREPELLREAFRNMPSLLVGECDVLIVDEIGKNYSGGGADSNIIGTFSTPFASGGVKVQRTAMLDLSGQSHGNALGIGLADSIPKRLFDKIDPEIMYPNCITSTVIASVKVPCVMADDEEAIRFCIRTCTGIDRDNARLIRISNSLHIETIMLSEQYYEDVREGKYAGVLALDQPEALRFDAAGTLLTRI